jgi:hypothetical protein
MGKFGGWLAGILAVIIGGYAVWYLTKPPATTTFEGMVYSGDAPVPNAMVAVELTGGAASGTYHDVTDDHGSYSLVFTGLPTATGATIRVTAPGYESADTQSLTSPLQGDIRLDFPLLPAAAPVKPAIAHIPPYIPKLDALTTKIKIKQ